MQNQNNKFSEYSVRKIPVTKQIETTNFEDEKYLDKIKILELSNVIDEWEKELLFSNNGFFSLKGKNVENKSTEFISELEKLVNSKISALKLSNSSSHEAVEKIKKLKIDNIKNQMQQYEHQELFNWEISVYTKTISSSIERAVLYKNDLSVIDYCFKTGLSVLDLVAEKEKWSNKVLKSRKDDFISDFYSALINAFLEEKDIRFVSYYEKYKGVLSEEKQKEFESIIEDMKLNIVAYNWSKELFSYNLDNDEQEKEIKKLNDEKLENAVRKNLKILKQDKENSEELENKDKVQKNWNELEKLLKEEPLKALLNIDLTQEKNIIKNQIDYINKMVKDGYLNTDKQKFISLLNEAFNDFQSFKNKNLLENKNYFSQVDYSFFQELQKKSDFDFISFKSDVSFLLKKLEEQKIKKIEDKYDCLIVLNRILNSDKEIDLDKKNKIIEALSIRYASCCNHQKKEIDKDDSIINKTGK